MSSLDISEPELPPDSPGSSVSTRLLDEYEELLKYAVVVPKYDQDRLPKTLTDIRESFPQDRPKHRQETLVTVTRERQTDNSMTDTNPIIVKITRETGLPDFGGQSPIGSKHEDEVLNDDAGSVEEFLAKTKERQKTQKFSAPKFLSHVTDGFDKETSRISQKGGELEETDYTFTATIDQDVTKMENLMDQWCLDLKRNVMAEFSQP